MCTGNDDDPRVREHCLRHAQSYHFRHLGVIVAIFIFISVKRALRYAHERGDTQLVRACARLA